MADQDTRDVGWKGGMFDIDIQSLQPEPVAGKDDEYWLYFVREAPEIDNLTQGSYFPGLEKQFFDSRTNTPGKFTVLETDWPKNRIKVKITD